MSPKISSLWMPVGSLYPAKTKNTTSDEHPSGIMEDYTASVEKKYSHIAEFDEINGNDFNFNPPYVDTFEEEEEIEMPIFIYNS